MGIGMTVIVSPEQATDILGLIRANRHSAWFIGEVVKGRGRVQLGTA